MGGELCVPGKGWFQCGVGGCTFDRPGVVRLRFIMCGLVPVKTTCFRNKSN